MDPLRKKEEKSKTNWVRQYDELPKTSISKIAEKWRIPGAQEEGEILKFWFQPFFSRVEPFWVMNHRKMTGSLVTLCEGNENRKPQKSVIFTNWTFEWFEAKKDIRKISSDHPRGKLYLLKNFFLEREIFEKCFSQYYLPFLQVSEKSYVQNYSKKFQIVKNAHFGPVCGLRHFFRKSGFATLNGLYWLNLTKKVRKL